ncbi:MAG: DUF5317 domain-containing protein [Actinomycetota bacterium]|jgi:uncharacterized protein YjeT (DUF2065 family)|nr:DUF5317 domain-containing protein [Actinomycetota bacterium]
MRLAVLATLGGLVVALLAGGRLANLSDERLRWPALAFVALALYWAPSLLGLDGPPAVALALAAYAALLSFAAANLRLVGMAVVALGLGLNALVILLNGGMPVDPAAVVATGLARPDEVAAMELGPSRQWQQEDDPLAVLGDIVPVTPLGEVVSFGDLILAGGLADVAFRLLHPLVGTRSRPAGPGRRRPRRSTRRLAASLSPAR